MKNRSEALAARLEAGAKAVAAFAAALTETEWQTRVPRDGRKIGVVVHHVASMYPIEIQFAQVLAAGQPIAGVDVRSAIPYERPVCELFLPHCSDALGAEDLFGEHVFRGSEHHVPHSPTA